MSESSSSGTRDLRLPLYVAIGAIGGGGYALFDAISESRLREGTLTGTMAQVHTFVDHVSPLFVGMLLGVCFHYLRLRERLSSAEIMAAHARARLHKVERDQAVWVLAAAVLHELNNPLHAIGLMVDELSRVDEDVEDRIALIERIRTQTHRARDHLRMLRAMPSRGEPEVQQLALGGVIEAVARERGMAATTDGLVVEAHCSPSVQANADPTYVRVIVENLVDNALAALRAGGGDRVTISVTEEAGRAVVRVHDDGPPIEPEVSSTLFEPLRSTKTHGLGLGLPIARALARAMSGDLSLEGSTRKTFRLELPQRRGDLGSLRPLS